MGRFNGKFDSAKQEWETPPEVFLPIHEEFGFTVDLAASAENRKCDRFISREQNALITPWSGIGWLNPPYGEGSEGLSRWVKRAVDESASGRCKVVMLIPARTNTLWWHHYCMTAAEVRFLCGRPRFGGADHGLPQPLALVVFDTMPTPTRFGSFRVGGRC